MNTFTQRALYLIVGCQMIAAITGQTIERFVSLNGTNDTAGGYTSWAGAATGIQYAINVCVSGDVVWVSNGTYEVGTTVDAGVTNRVVINQAITVRSLNNDPTNTTIKGAVNIRPVYMVANSTLIGFTLTNGSFATTVSGGGLLGPTTTNAVASNCLINGNAGLVSASGGGVRYCTLYNCQIVANTGVHGGGARNSVLYDCLVSGNLATNYGGGMRDCSAYGSTIISNTAWIDGGGGYGGGIMSNCTLSGNTAQGSGGGGSICDLYDCRFIGNSAVANGGGVQAGSAYKLYNCIISNNISGDGGGVWAGSLYNCQLIGNSATNYGGGVSANARLLNCLVKGNWATIEGGAAYQCKLTNCLVIGNAGRYGGVGGNWNLSMLYNCTLSGNSSASGYPISRDSTFVNCISWSNNNDKSYPDSGISNYYSLSVGAAYTNGGLGGCITNDPLFIANGTGGYGTNLVPGNYRLQAGSPCINTGTNQGWMDGAVDLDGHLRLDHFSRQVDMGAYEFLPAGTMFTVR